MRCAACRERRPDGDARRLGAEGAQLGRHDLHRPARSLRPDADRRRGALVRRDPPDGRRTGPRIRPASDGPRHRTRVEESQAAHGRDRDRGRCARDPQPLGRSSLHDRGGVGRRRRPAHEIPLPRPAPAAVAAGADPAAPDGARRAHVPRRGGIPRNRNPLPDQVHARGGARLRGAEPHEPQPVLCAAAVAADAQTAAHGGRLRQIFPDRALLPRRGSARRPSARIHADRLRNVVRRAGGRAGSVRALGEAYVPRGAGHRLRRAVPPDAVDRGDGEVRIGQTRPALRHGVPRRDRPCQGARVRRSTSAASPLRDARVTPASRSTR